MPIVYFSPSWGGAYTRHPCHSFLMAIFSVERAPRAIPMRRVPSETEQADRFRLALLLGAHPSDPDSGETGRAACSINADSIVVRNS